MWMRLQVALVSVLQCCLGDCLAMLSSALKQLTALLEVIPLVFQSVADPAFQIIAALQDYTPESVLLTFSPTNTRLTVPISIIEDSTNEETEEFFARLLFEVAPTGRVELQPQQTTIQITDNDGIAFEMNEWVMRSNSHCFYRSFDWVQGDPVLS